MSRPHTNVKSLTETRKALQQILACLDLNTDAIDALEATLAPVAGDGVAGGGFQVIIVNNAGDLNVKPVGADGTALVADSGEPLGVRWGSVGGKGEFHIPLMAPGVLIEF